MAGLNTSLVKSHLQYSTLQGSWSSSSTPQEQSKLFWSVFLLDTFYGPPILVPSVAHDINSPCFSAVGPRYSSLPCPQLPRESNATLPGRLPNIWPHSIRIFGLWGDIRTYISRCFEGSVDAPWQPTSDYTVLCSRLMDIELEHPLSLSYNTVKLPDCSPQQVQDNRAEWLPWVRLQVTYHAIHCVLNHPFLYSIKTPKQKLGADTFWRASSDKALRHCTWISRLIKMASQKGLVLADPFFSQAAAIAGTLHSYWTQSSDVELRNAALANLKICQELIADMAPCWPACESVVSHWFFYQLYMLLLISSAQRQALDQFINLVSPSDQRKSFASTKAVVKKSLMWIILDMTAAQFPGYSPCGSCDKNTEDPGPDTQALPLTSAEVNSPPARMRESTAHYASPPEWLSSRSDGETSPATTRVGMTTAHQDGLGQPFIEMVSDVGDVASNFDLSWGPWENIMPSGTNSMCGLNWWDYSSI